MTVPDDVTLPGVTFECRVLHVLQGLVGARYQTPSESEAVEWARAQVSPYVEHVSIEAAGSDVATFAMRYVKPDSDSGWRCWRDGTFTGVVSLEVLFADRAVAS